MYCCFIFLGAGDRLMDLTSRDGDWFLDELCSMSSNVMHFIDTLTSNTLVRPLPLHIQHRTIFLYYDGWSIGCRGVNVFGNRPDTTHVDLHPTSCVNVLDMFPWLRSFCDEFVITILRSLPHLVEYSHYN